jgi:hypothetical protein
MYAIFSNGSVRWVSSVASAQEIAKANGLTIIEMWLCE